MVGEGSEVSDEAILEAHVVVGRRCRVGRGAWLHPHVVLYDDVTVGPRTEVHSGAVLGADGFGYAAGPAGLRKVPQVGGVVIGADAEIGANTCIDRATLETTTVGDGSKIDDLVMIGHNCDVGNHVVLCGQVGIAGSTTVGDQAVLAGQVGVAGHLKIGRGVKAGGQTADHVRRPGRRLRLRDARSCHIVRLPRQRGAQASARDGAPRPRPGEGSRGEGLSAEESGSGLGIREILEVLPHRYPFLLVDRILEIVPGKKVVGLKNVTVNEEFFQGHFPGNPVMPGVLLVEAMAQVGAFMMLDGRGRSRPAGSSAWRASTP